MAIGPVQLIVLGFQHPEFHGEIIAELERLKENQTGAPGGPPPVLEERDVRDHGARRRQPHGVDTGNARRGASASRDVQLRRDGPARGGVRLVGDRLIGRAADQEVDAVEPGANAAATIHDLVEAGTYQEITLSTVPEHHHLWHRHGLTDRVQHLGVAVTVIPPELNKWGPVEGFPEGWTPKEVSPAAIAGFGNY